jgi:hypothetical protein
MPPPLGVASVGNAQLCKGDKPCGERSEKRGGPSALFCNSTPTFPILRPSYRAGQAYLAITTLAITTLAWR